VFKTDVVTALTTIRDSLRENLQDPYETAGGNARETWVYADEPITSAKFPIVEVKKADNPSDIISFGNTDYWEQDVVYMNIWFSCKNGFKITVSGTAYVNTKLCEYYFGLIKQALKAANDTLFTAGVKGLKAMNTTKVEYDPTTQLYFGAVTMRIYFFHQD